MRVIFLRINIKKLKIGFTILMAFTLCGLAIAAYQVNQLERLFLAIPRTSSNSISVNNVEEINGRVVLTTYGTEVEQTTVSRVMLTYERRQNRSINALQSRHDVNLIGTNHSHPHVLNHNLIHGNFFSQEALNHAHNVVTLNKIAAFEIFGNIYAGGNELWINNMPTGSPSVFRVIGVIDDGDNENLNIYIPVTILSNTVDSIAANFSINPDLSAEYIQAIWHQMGITSDRYHLMNFDTINAVMQDRLILTASLLLMGLLLWGISKAIKAVHKEWHTVIRLRREMYMPDLIKATVFRRMVGITACIIAMAATIGFIGLSAFERGLYAYDSHGMLADVHSEAFLVQIEMITQWYNMSLIFFWGGVIGFLGFAVLLWSKQRHCL